MSRTTTINYNKIKEFSKTKFYNNNWFVWIFFYLLWILSPYILEFIKNFIWKQ